MIVVVAAREDEVGHVQARLGELGEVGDFNGLTVAVKAVGGGRSLVLATVADHDQAEHLATALRGEGALAVVRPEAGPRLDGWMRHTEPIRFGARLTVCFAWAEHDRAGLPGLIELGPGGFGNGGHPTTRLLVELLIERFGGGERVLDVGCGSGVLGLCALELGASHVTAVDLKPEAIAATQRNAVLNGVGSRLEATVAPLATIEDGFDVIVANIGRGATVELAPQLVRLLAPGGWIAVSGISPPQCSLVAGFLRPLCEVEQRISGEWAVSVLAHGDPER